MWGTPKKERESCSLETRASKRLKENSGKETSRWIRRSRSRDLESSARD